MEDYELHGRRGGGAHGILTMIVISFLTSLVVSVFVFAILTRYGVAGVGGPASSQGAQAAGEVEVPDVVGIPAEATKRFAGPLHLVFEVTEERADSQAAAGNVVEQSEAAGTVVAHGTTIELVVSTGPERVAVPPLAGKTLDVARAALTAAGLMPGAVYETGQGGAPGTVTGSEPAEGTEIEPSATVALTVVPTGVEVPRVVGKRLPIARETLTQAGFRLGRQREEFDPDHGPFVILAQEPAGGSSAPAGTEVSLTVNQGP
jgi:serine/threonine-protein kinase